MRLVPLSASHVPDLEGLLADPDVLAFTLVPDEPGAGFAENWVTRYEEKRATDTGDGWAVVDEAGTFVALALVPRLSRERSECELGYIVAPAARGRGVGAWTLSALTTWALEEQSLERAELLIAPENAGSIAMARRAGYTHEGTLRNTYFKDNRRSDVQIWSRIRGDR